MKKIIIVLMIITIISIFFNIMGYSQLKRYKKINKAYLLQLETIEAKSDRVLEKKDKIEEYYTEIIEKQEKIISTDNETIKMLEIILSELKIKHENLTKKYIQATGGKNE